MITSTRLPTPRGNVTTFGHNEIGQTTLEQHDDADSSTNFYAYNADGTLASSSIQLTASTSADTSYIYDDYKRVRTITDPLGHVTNFWYDTAGSGVADLTHTDANATRLVLPAPGSKVTKTVYDANLRKDIVTVGYGTSDAATTNYDYDPVGNLIKVTDPKFFAWNYFYDARNRLNGFDDPIAAIATVTLRPTPSPTAMTQRATRPRRSRPTTRRLPTIPMTR
jgi:YD repeat-containing protein